MSFITICEEGSDPVEVPCESDGTLLLSTVTGQFSNACGLKYKNQQTGVWQYVKMTEDRLFSPEEGWGNIFQVVYPQVADTKGVNANKSVPPAAKGQTCVDLVVLGLPYECTETDVSNYFSNYGPLSLVQVKRDPNTGHSKGFGFIRFSQYESQAQVLSQRHLIEGRWCDVRIPTSKTGDYQNSSQARKIFVGRCTEDMTADDFREYFTQFGEVIDVYIPKPFRSFAFVTFTNPEVAQSLFGGDHVIKGVSVHISTASPREQRSNRYSNAVMPTWNQYYPNSQNIPATSNNVMGQGNIALGGVNIPPPVLAAAIQQNAMNILSNLVTQQRQ